MARPLKHWSDGQWNTTGEWTGVKWSISGSDVPIDTVQDVDGVYVQDVDGVYVEAAT